MLNLDSDSFWGNARPDGLRFKRKQGITSQALDHEMKQAFDFAQNKLEFCVESV